MVARPLCKRKAIPGASKSFLLQCCDQKRAILLPHHSPIYQQETHIDCSNAMLKWIRLHCHHPNTNAKTMSHVHYEIRLYNVGANTDVTSEIARVCPSTPQSTNHQFTDPRPFSSIVEHDDLLDFIGPSVDVCAPLGGGGPKITSLCGYLTWKRTS